MWKEWKSVIYYISDNVKFNSSIAIFNYYYTLSTKGNKITFPNTIDVLNDINIKGGSVIIYQCATHNTLQNVIDSINFFISQINFPIMIFISCEKNNYYKPFTGILKVIELFYKHKNKKIDKNKSIVVGNNAGRINNNKKIDYSASDRFFANNIGVKFYTPELFFLKKETYKKWSSDSIIGKEIRKQLLCKKNNIFCVNDEIKKLPQSEIYTIIVTGPPISGKTNLSNKIKAMYEKELIQISENDINEINEINEIVKKKNRRK